MKKILIIIGFCFGLVVPFSLRAQETEKIESFRADYNLTQEGTIKAQEEIIYNFGAQQKHGIFRYLPYKYQMKEGGTEYINISNIKVRDVDDKGIPFERSKANGNLVLKIGDKNRTITGTKVYVLSYEIKGALRYLDTDEFFWNVTGNGWEVPIENVQARVVTYKNFNDNQLSATCYYGPFDSKERCAGYKIFQDGAEYEQSNLVPHEGLSIVFAAPKGTYPVVSAGYLGSGLSQNFVKTLVYIAVFIPFLVFLFMTRHFLKWGRDAKGRGAIVVEYEPPEKITPIEMGTILDFSVSNKDISSELIYLATKGFLKIVRIPGKGLKKDDYTLKKLKDSKLSGFDEVLLSGIFKSGNEVKISDLKNDFYENIQKIKTQVHGKVVKDGYFRERVATVIGKYVGIGGGIASVGLLILFTFSVLNGVLATIFGPSLIVTGLIVIIFGFFMPARTKEGVIIKERILGFKRYLSKVEGRKINWSDAPKKDPKKFEEYLPYAMVFGVEKEWAKQFEGIYDGSPSWYNDPSGARFMPVVFASNMNGFATSATQNMFSAPTSSGSGFSGGSGGGFGGGGGGSW